MRNGKILIAVLIVIGGIIVLLPTIGGYIFKRNYFSLVENINTDNHYKVTIQQYNEGWFSSEATLNVLIRQNHFMPMTSLLVNQTIKHGPFIHGRAGFTAGLAEIDTRLPLANLIANPSLTKQLVDVFLQADTLATFNGQWLSHFQIPALQLLLPNQIKVLAQALSGEIKFATSNKFINQVETSLQLGTVELQTQNNLFGRIIIQPSQLSSQSIRQASGIWNLTSHLTCPGFRLWI